MARPHALTGEVRPDLWLPPEELRLWNPSQDGRLETPLDTRGLVDLNDLVSLGKETVHPSFDWQSPFNDVHHLQWPGAAYTNETVAMEFRELIQRKAYIPRRFHNWLHAITEPPPLPTEEVMRHCIAAERTVRALSSTAMLATKLTRMKTIPDAKLQKRLEQEFENYSLYIQNAREVPREFQLLKLAEVEARSVDEMLAASRHLGKRALHLVPIRHRELRIA